jgi:hypothetical protein
VRTSLTRRKSDPARLAFVLQLAQLLLKSSKVWLPLRVFATSWVHQGLPRCPAVLRFSVTPAWAAPSSERTRISHGLGACMLKQVAQAKGSALQEGRAKMAGVLPGRPSEQPSKPAGGKACPSGEHMAQATPGRAVAPFLRTPVYRCDLRRGQGGIFALQRSWRRQRLASVAGVTGSCLSSAIPGSVGRCLIHWATGPLLSSSGI